MKACKRKSKKVCVRVIYEEIDRQGVCDNNNVRITNEIEKKREGRGGRERGRGIEIDR